MRTNRIKAVGLAALLVTWSLVAPRLPSRWHPVPHAIVGAGLAALTRAPVGFRHPGPGLRFGLGSTVPVVFGVAAATAVPRVREDMAGRELPDGALRWLLVGIPLGTVWSEEAAFRGALGTLAAEAFGPTGGRFLQAAAFGFSHVADARSTGEPVVPTVLITGLAGWVFGWLYERSGSLIAPMLAHLAINEAGAVAALTVQNTRARAISL
ncbi:lysostaphin resistance A-like protein [Mycobacterium sp. NPDC051804]|uniref:Rv0804 family intramembrane glutamic endopeptidase n=1 Tax=Mycobacterium sp. NPDC051804 TaxID=3364295 RepID=UPI0037BA5642